MSEEHKYIEEFVRLSCAPDLLSTYLFPNAKEITESFACYDAVRKYIWEDISPRDDKIIFFAVGDGNQPRTAATFAHRTKWTCVSIDPLLSIGNNKYYTKHPKIERLYMLRDKVENIKEPFIKDLDSRIVIIGLVHSHAQINDVYDKLKGRETYIISIPCCVRQDDIYGRKPDVEYEDVGIWSTKNLVKLWKFK
jgi:hypothetical protein